MIKNADAVKADCFLLLTAAADSQLHTLLFKELRQKYYRRVVGG
jgi:hypothetical protein